MNFLSILVLIFSPAIAGLMLYSKPFKNNEVLIRRFAKGFASLHFLYTILFLVFFNPANEGISYFKEITFFKTSWAEPIGLKMIFGLDGLSLVMVLLTAFVFLLALIASKNVINGKHKFYYSLILFLETALLGTFCARDMFLFFMFWELELIPMYFLIGQWGDKSAKNSAMKFVLYTFLGSLFLLLGILLLHFYNFATYGDLTADISAICVSSPDFPIFMQMVISVLFLIGFGVKMPIVPLHTWLPNAHVDAPTPVSMILAAVLLKMGAYGIIRFNMAMLPEAFKVLAPILMIFALVNIIYCAVIAYAQTDLKRIVAYSSISSMGIVLLGICSLNLIGLSGAVFQMVAHGIISAGLFMIVGIIYLRTKTRDISQLGGLGHVMPRLMGFSLIIALASIGIPLLIGFVGEFLVFWGSFNSPLDDNGIPVQLYTLIAIFVLLLSAAYILKLLHQTFFANIFERWSAKGGVKDIVNNEFAVLIAISLVIGFLGIFPMAVLDLITPALGNLLTLFGGGG